MSVPGKLLSHVLLLFAFAAGVSAHSDLNEDQLEMLLDSDGWQYIVLSDADGGIQTNHTCFDGRPHPDVCSGTLTFSEDNTFVANIYIHGKNVPRNGTYKLDGDQLAFFDEFGTRDGPYTIELDVDAKSLIMKMPQVRVVLELEKEYKRGTQPLK
ncbi:MAG TPA: lipocalin family protein [Bryobacteraceae bacterium]|nr:lipocalin family protein [Bryobacteraceae bacterium]